MDTRLVLATLAASVFSGFLGIGAERSAAATLWVGNNGTDGLACGAQNKPCRSISQAIENATDGDTIEVGEGRYGDITGAGTYRGGGDEHGQQAEITGCMLCITKAVHVLSLHGAAVTFIQETTGGPFGAAVEILHDGVTFGTKGNGFTIAGSSYGVLVAANTRFTTISIVQPIRVAGNVAVGVGTGFSYFGPEFVDRPCIGCVFTGQVLFSDNEADADGTGVQINTGQNDGEPIVIQNNVARNGGTGFSLVPGPANEAALTVIGGGNVSFLNNVATGNGIGFNTNSSGDIRGNIASGNSQIGFVVVPGGGLFTGNTAVGNAGPGVVVQYSADGQSPDPTGSPPSFRSFSSNNFFGNDRNRPQLQLTVQDLFGAVTSFDAGPGAHCGVLNVGALAWVIEPGQTLVPVHLKADNNYWGSASGPSASGVGDAVGGACDQNKATTTAVPFATAFF